MSSGSSSKRILQSQCGLGGFIPSGEPQSILSLFLYACTGIKLMVWSTINRPSAVHNRLLVQVAEVSHHSPVKTSQKNRCFSLKSKINFE